MKYAMKNFHLPLSEDMYNALKIESKYSKKPATQLARTAIEKWLKGRKKEMIYKEVAQYALEEGGTPHDLDVEMESIGVEYWLSQENR